MRSTNPKIINLVLDSMGKIGDSVQKSRSQKKRIDREYLVGHFIQAGIEHPATCDCRFPGDDHWHATHGEFNHEYHTALKVRGFLPILREAAEKDLLTGNDEYGKSGALKSELRKLLDGFLVEDPDPSWFGEKRGNPMQISWEVVGAAFQRAFGSTEGWSKEEMEKLASGLTIELEAVQNTQERAAFGPDPENPGRRISKE